MPYLWIKWPSASGSKAAFDINFGQEGISRVSIHSWGATGLNAATSLPAITLKVLNQPSGGLYGNGGSLGFPLFVPSTPNASVQLENPILVTEGDNIWNGSHRLELELHDYAGNPLNFTDFSVLFHFVTRDPFHMREQPPHDFQTYKETTQSTTRNQAHLPGVFYY